MNGGNADKADKTELVQTSTIGAAPLISVNEFVPSNWYLCGVLSKWELLTMTEKDEYAKARKRAETKYRFFVHAAVYAAVMVLLVLIDLLTPETMWFIWPLIGWGFAVVLHGLGVYALADKSAVIDALTEQELRRSSADKTEFGRQ